MSQDECTGEQPRGVSRRTIVRGAAWITPSVAVAVAVPAAAASGCSIAISVPAPVLPFAKYWQSLTVTFTDAPSGVDLILDGGATFTSGKTTMHLDESPGSAYIVAGPQQSTVTVAATGSGRCTASAPLPVTRNPVPAARAGLVTGANRGDHGGAGTNSAVIGFQPSDAWLVWSQRDGGTIRAAALAPSPSGDLGAVVLADNSVRLNTGSAILTMPNPESKTWVDLTFLGEGPKPEEVRIMLLSEDGRIFVATATPSGFTTVADAGLPADAFVISMTAFGNNGGTVLGMAVDTKRRTWTNIGNGTPALVPQAADLDALEISANLTDFYIRVVDTRGTYVSANGWHSVWTESGRHLSVVKALAKGNIATRTMAFLTFPMLEFNDREAYYISGVYVLGPNDGKALDANAPETDNYTRAHLSTTEWGVNSGPRSNRPAKVTAIALGAGSAKALTEAGEVWSAGVTSDGTSGDSTIPVESTAPANVRCTYGAGNPLSGITGLAASSGRTFLAFGG